MVRSTRSSGKASEGAKAKTAATVSKKRRKTTSASMSSSPIASVSKKRPSRNSRSSRSSSKKAPATKTTRKTTTTTTTKSPASSKKQTNTAKRAKTTPSSRSPPSSSTKPPPSQQRRPTTASTPRSLSFPPPRRFLVGTALSVYQNSGGPDTNWSVFEAKRAWGGLRPAILGDTPCGRSSGFWDGNFDADAELARSVGSNCLRLSLEWSRVVPRPGVVDAAAVARYREIFDSLERRGMEVLVTLHHFVHPSWFDDVCGGFESDEGLRHFVEWSKIAFAAFGNRIASWCTFNEPGVFASSGYCTGFFPPGKVLHLRTAGEVLLRMLRSHTAAVGEMRRMSAAMHKDSEERGGGERLKTSTKKPSEIPRHSFGIVHNVMPYEAKSYFAVAEGLDLAEDAASVEQGFHSGMTIEAEREFEEAQAKEERKKKRARTNGDDDDAATTSSLPSSPVPYPPPSRDPSRGWAPPWSRAAAALGHAQWGNDVVLRYLSTGVFEWDPLGGCLPPPLMRAARLLLGERRIARLDRIKEREKPPLDWFGLNFYGRVVLDWKLAPTCYRGETMSDFGQGLWPAGFKAAIRRAGRELGVPVIVTETGVPDGTDAVRSEWADSYLGALEEVLQEEEEEEEEEEKGKGKGKGKRGKGAAKGAGAGAASAAAAPASANAVVDLRGVCYWSLVDSFEWAFGYSWFTKFGLFAWDFQQGPEGARTRRPSADKVKGWFKRLSGVAERSWRRRGLEFEASFPPRAASSTGKKRVRTAAS